MNKALTYIISNQKLKITIIVVVVIIVLLVAGIIIAKATKLKGLIINQKANQDLIDEANKSIIVDDITIPQDQMNSYATKLYIAMKGIGTDEAAIYTILDAMQTRSDILQLIKTFGYKDDKNLIEWLNKELTNKELNKVNQILGTKSINYKF